MKKGSVDKIKILTISDRVEPSLYEHFDRKNFPGDIELIISCGDLPPEYLSFIVTMFNVPLFYVRGNHDIRYESRPPGGCMNIHEKIITHKGIRILGFEGSRWYNGGPVQYTEKQMASMIRKVKWRRLWWDRKVHIVVTHAPPRHINDRDDQCHRGFKCFHHLIELYKPRYFIHGHIHARFDHPHQRMAKLGTTKIINAFGYYILDIDL